MSTTTLHQTAVHHDEGHEHEHHEGNFWTNYIFCQDHKIIAKQFLITGMPKETLGKSSEKVL